MSRNPADKYARYIIIHYVTLAVGVGSRSGPSPAYLVSVEGDVSQPVLLPALICHIDYRRLRNALRCCNHLVNEFNCREIIPGFRLVKSNNTFISLSKVGCNLYYSFYSG